MNDQKITDTSTSEIPLGLGMALAENIEALKRFARLTIPQQQEVIENAHTVTTSAEMRAYVASIGKPDTKNG
ncbi:MAG: hypothetical protein IJB44_02430 [Clostridia bacterium]|nr:hypothetical protein [Clostridia bacterium]